MRSESLLLAKFYLGREVVLDSLTIRMKQITFK